jgi:putative radical SAM enzyme (TIGR03279 family)
MPAWFCKLWGKKVKLETETHTAYSGQIAAVTPGGLAEELGLQAGDELLSINGHPLCDVIDVQFYAAEEYLELLLRRAGALTLYEVERDYDQPLGLEFAHPTFDVDVRRCNNLCEFCFVLQMPPHLRRTLYVKDDDYRYSFLQGQYVTLTNLSPQDWARIEAQHLSPLYVSVHATDPALRRKLLGNPEAPDVMAQLRHLGRCGIQVHTQIVVTPGLNDGPQLDCSITDLATLWPAVRSISVVPVGITRYHKYGHRPHTHAEARTVLEQVSAHQKAFLARCGVRLVYLTDEWYLMLGAPVPPLDAYDGLALQENGVGMVRAFMEEWQVASGEWRSAPFRQSVFSPVDQVTLVTGTLFAPTLAKVAHEFAGLTGVKANVVAVVNRALGETITVAGLLMGRDVINQLQEHRLGELVILPRVMFDHPLGIALDDLSPDQIAQALDRPVALADGMHDVWNTITTTM